jgi:transposase
MIRSSSHTINFANIGKKETYWSFLKDYRATAVQMVEQVWNGYEDFNILNDKLELPKYLDYKAFKLETKLSARALSSLTTQVSGVIRAATEKRRRLLWGREQMLKDGKPISRMDKKIHKCKLVKPDASRLNPELSSKNLVFVDGPDKTFGIWIKLQSLGEYGKILIPLKETEISKKWGEKGERLGSVMLTGKSAILRFEVEQEKKKSGKRVGADEGMKTVLTLSDKQIPPQTDIHGHSLESILGIMARKKKGSKAFRKAQEHRKNFINWSINQLNFSDIKVVALEKVSNINFGKRVSRKMRAWTNPIIVEKVKRLCEEQGVLVVMQDSTYRSQRCSHCGNVRKSNRKGKIYKCKHCGFEVDSDLNASLNHEAELPALPFGLRGSKKNLGDGFLWLPSGIFTLSGEELRVPSSSFSSKPKVC